MDEWREYEEMREEKECWTLFKIEHANECNFELFSMVFCVRRLPIVADSILMLFIDKKSANCDSGQWFKVSCLYLCKRQTAL